MAAGESQSYGLGICRFVRVPFSPLLRQSLSLTRSRIPLRRHVGLYWCALMSTPVGSPCPTPVLFNHAALPGRPVARHPPLPPLSGAGPSARPAPPLSVLPHRAASPTSAISVPPPSYSSSLSPYRPSAIHRLSLHRFEHASLSSRIHSFFFLPVHLSVIVPLPFSYPPQSPLPPPSAVLLVGCSPFLSALLSQRSFFLRPCAVTQSRSRFPLPVAKIAWIGRCFSLLSVCEGESAIRRIFPLSPPPVRDKAATTRTQRVTLCRRRAIFDIPAFVVLNHARVCECVSLWNNTSANEAAWTRIEIECIPSRETCVASYSTSKGR